MVVCNSQGEKMYIDDSSGGMLLHSNTEAPGEEVVSAHLTPKAPYLRLAKINRLRD